MTALSTRLAKLRADLAAGLTEAPADRRIFLINRHDKAEAELAAWAALEATGAQLPPLAGVLLSVKSCFDMEGWVTSSASASTFEDAPAQTDAPTLAALRAAGAVVLGQTNMTEFAYGALGINTRFGTPRTPLDASGARVAGGSTSGGAVAAALGVVDLTLGSDTSGSARIPAAFCGIYGFKPSLGRYPAGGIAHLSQSFDVPGLLSADLGLILTGDQAITGRAPQAPADAKRLRYGLPTDYDTLAIDADVRAAFDAALETLTAAGVQIERIALPMLAESARVTAAGGVIGSEAYAIHQDRLAARFDDYDPLVGARILKAGENLGHRYASAKLRLEELKAAYDTAIQGFDGILLPTTPMIAPVLAALGDLDTYLATNIRAFSLTEYANRLELPSITLPMGRLPTGFMLTGLRAGDDALLAQAQTLAALLARVQNS